MFVVIKYGNNETILVNPNSSVINLLTSIKRRAGTSKTIDLSDENGLIKDLDVHKYDMATKFLQSHETYVLVQKELMLEDGGSPMSTDPQYTFIPLLERYTELFPNFRIHVAEVPDSQKSKRVRTGQKSPSPAGKLLGKNAKERQRRKEEEKEGHTPRKNNRRK